MPVPDSTILTLVRRVIMETELDAIDARSAVVVIGPVAAEGFTARMRERLVQRRSMVIVALGASPGPGALAVALLADVAFAPESASIRFDHPSGERNESDVDADLVAGLTFRVGRGAMAILIGDPVLPAARALELGLLDALVPRDEDPIHWVESWLRGRSLIALQSASRLIRLRGGEAVERAEFARLFALGEPQRGLQGFLDKRSTDFSETVKVETL